MCFCPGKSFIDYLELNNPDQREGKGCRSEAPQGEGQGSLSGGADPHSREQTGLQGQGARLRDVQGCILLGLFSIVLNSLACFRRVCHPQRSSWGSTVEGAEGYGEAGSAPCTALSSEAFEKEDGSNEPGRLQGAHGHQRQGQQRSPRSREEHRPTGSAAGGQKT